MRIQLTGDVVGQSGVADPGGDDLAAGLAWHGVNVSARFLAGKAGFYSCDSHP